MLNDKAECVSVLIENGAALNNEYLLRVINVISESQLKKIILSRPDNIPYFQEILDNHDKMIGFQLLGNTSKTRDNFCKTVTVARIVFEYFEKNSKPQDKMNEKEKRKAEEKMLKSVRSAFKKDAIFARDLAGNLLARIENPLTKKFLSENWSKIEKEFAKEIVKQEQKLIKEAEKAEKKTGNEEESKIVFKK